MHDEQLKQLLLSEPSLKARQEFRIMMNRQLNLLSNDKVSFFKISRYSALVEKKNYWQYLVMALMTILTVLIMTHHQQTDHMDDELAKVNSITELTLSTL